MKLTMSAALRVAIARSPPDLCVSWPVSAWQPGARDAACRAHTAAARAAGDPLRRRPSDPGATRLPRHRGVCRRAGRTVEVGHRRARPRQHSPGRVDQPRPRARNWSPRGCGSVAGMAHLRAVDGTVLCDHPNRTRNRSCFRPFATAITTTTTVTGIRMDSSTARSCAHGRGSVPSPGAWRSLPSRRWSRRSSTRARLASRCSPT